LGLTRKRTSWRELSSAGCIAIDGEHQLRVINGRIGQPAHRGDVSGKRQREDTELGLLVIARHTQQIALAAYAGGFLETGFTEHRHGIQPQNQVFVDIGTRRMERLDRTEGHGGFQCRYDLGRGNAGTGAKNDRRKNARKQGSHAQLTEKWM
jgi:hypothetical protein